MKKLLFIIPKVCFKILFLFALSSLATQAKAQIFGCHVVVGMSDRLFYTPYGAGSPTEWQTVISGPVTSTGETGGYRSDGSATYGCIANIGGACTVYQQYLMMDGVTIGMRPYRIGVYASIDPVNCPIDDYIPFILITIASIGFLQIRKIPIFNSENENIDHHRSL